MTVMRLEELEIFKNIDSVEINKLLSCSKSVKKRLTEGEYLFRQSDKPVYMYVILRGEAVISKDFSSG